MKSTVSRILKRELRSLDDKSKEEGLGLNDFKRLDLLIKAWKSFAAESGDEEKEAAEEIATAELLKGIDV